MQESAVAESAENAENAENAGGRSRCGNRTTLFCRCPQSSSAEEKKASAIKLKDEISREYYEDDFDVDMR